VKQPLPIDPLLPAVVQGLRERGSLLLMAEPGAGKTTRVPPALCQAWSDGAIVVLEPRRLAARAAAARVAAELGGEVGGLVGYQVRGDRAMSKATRIRFVTEGVLVRQLVHDPFLEGVAAVCLDEFHERHLEGDLALAMLREVQQTVRPDLALCVMSATLDPAPLRAFLPGAAAIEAEGRLYPVRIEHAARPDDDPVEHRVRRAVERALAETAGDVLVFLPGTGEIRRCQQALADLGRRHACLVLPLHGRLDARDAERAIARQDRRKVVLSTNVAESSLTIEGVTAVVDLGLHRILRHDRSRGVDVLATQRISLASAIQRAGRAGRTAPGTCYRLWTAGEERGMAERDPPEVRRVDLCGPALQVRAFAGRDPRQFGWFEAPEPHALAAADALLFELGAVDPDGRVTETGRELLALPVHPRLGRVVLEGRARGCAGAAATAAALLSEAEDLGRRGAGSADLAAATEALLVGEGTDPGLGRGELRAVQRARDRLLGRRAPDRDPDALGRCLLAGFPDRVVVRSGRHARVGTMVGGRGVELPEAACADADLLLALRLFEAGAGRTRSQAVVVAALEEAWLHDLQPARVDTVVRAELDEAAGRLLAVREVRYRDLPLRSARGGELPPGAAQEFLLPLLRGDPWRWLGAQPRLRRLLHRAAWLRAQQPELGLPAWSDDAVVGLLAGGTDLRPLRDADVGALLLAQLPAALRRALEREAPDRLTLPSGRQAAVDYGASGGPMVAARIQELFGLQRAPALASGRVGLVLEIQGPNHRPVQVTADLASFWRNVYPGVRAELARRHPRHAWPEDPLAAPPQSRPHRRR
jgi:ATP-dependent helicase HrpB